MNCFIRPMLRLLAALLCLLCLGSAQAQSANIDGKVQLAFSGLLFNRTTNTFDTVATLKNISTETILAPVSLVVTSISNAQVTLANAAGVNANGKPYVGVNVPAAGLLPGASVGGIVLRFSNPARIAFTFTRSAFGVVSVPLRVASLIPQTLGISEGANGNLTLTLTAPVAASTFVAVSSSNPGVVDVAGGGVTVDAGQTQAVLSVFARAAGSAQLTASLGNSSAASAITVTPAPVSVASLLPAVSTLTQGAGTTLRLTLSAAQSTPTTVQLAAVPSDIVSLPFEVVVPEGVVGVLVQVVGLIPGQAEVTASLGGSSAAAAVNVVSPPLQVLSVVPATFTMAAGASSQFTVNINAARPEPVDIRLTSNQPGVVSVPSVVTVPAGRADVQFTATAVAVGDATIVAAANNTEAATRIHVSPQPVALVSLLPNPFALQQGATGLLSLRINVAQETDTLVALTNSAPGIVQVPATATVPAGSLGADIAVTALLDGSAEIAAAANGSFARTRVDVTLPPPAVRSLTPASVNSPKGTPAQFTVTLSRAPNADTFVPVESRFPGIASVVGGGVTVPAGQSSAPVAVLTQSEGTTQLTATLNGGSASAAIVVSEPELVSLALSTLSPAIAVGATTSFLAAGTMTDGSLQDFTGRVAWSSSNAAVATVDAAGLATALGAGTATIGASFAFNAVTTGQSQTVSQTTDLTVRAAQVLRLDAPATELSVGGSVQVTVTSGDPAPAGGLRISLGTGGSGSATVPPSVLIAAGTTTASFPLTATSPGSLTVTALAAGYTAAGLTFSLQPALRIDSLSPASGTVGTLVTLSGTGFDPLANGNQITLRSVSGGTVTAAATGASATQLSFRIPALADNGPIRLVNARGATESTPFSVVREQDFQLIATPANANLLQGSSTAAQLQLSSTGSLPFTGLLALTAEGLPAGVTVSFSPAAAISATQMTTANFAATSGALPGGYPIVIRAAGTEGGQTFVRNAQVTLVVKAAAGETGVRGRFLDPDGQGISGVIVRAELAPDKQPQAVSDGAGNFVLTGLPAGPVMLRFDATAGNAGTPVWGSTITLAANTIAALPDWVVQPPPPAERFTSIDNATQDQVIVDERYPDLEIRLPAGVTIIGWDGVPKSRLAVERLDPDRLPISPPPIPTRSVYQIFWGTPMGGIPSQPIPVTLPNDLGLDPGEQTELWYYDAPPNGGEGVWRNGGTGTASADGKRIVTDPGSGIPRFCGVCGMPCFKANQDAGPPSPPPPPPPTCPPSRCGRAVTLATGQEAISAVDLTVAGLVPLAAARSFHPGDPFNNIAGTQLSLGLGWAFEYDAAVLPFSAQQVRVILAGNNRVDFAPDGSGGFAVGNDSRFNGARLAPGAGDVWTLSFKDGRTWRFGKFGLIYRLTEQRDTNGNALLVARADDGKILSIQGGQRSLSFSYGGNGFVDQIRDVLGRTVRYTYNAAQRIETVTAPDGGATRYTYVDDTEFAASPACTAARGGVRLKSIQRPGQSLAQVLHYGPGRRVLREVLEDGSENRFAYKLVGACVTHVSAPTVACSVNCPDTDSWQNFEAGWRIHGGQIAEATFTDANGNTHGQRLNPSGIAKERTDALGRKTQYTLDNNNQLTRMSDSLGRVTRRVVDAATGNLLSVTDPLSRVTAFEYDPIFNKVTVIRRTLGTGAGAVTVSRRIDYDPRSGNPIRFFDPLGRVTTLAYTGLGQLASITVPGNRTTRFEYNLAGDLVRVVDPLGNDVQLTPDLVGRITRVTDPLGFDTLTEYNAVDQVTRTTDALGGITQFGYDARRFMTGVVNPLGNTIEAYDRDANGRLTRRTDARLKPETLARDAGGNLRQLTDRRGQVVQYGYDALDRITRIDFADGTVQTRSYDAVGRVAEIREGTSAIAYAYDDADRLIRETTENLAGRHEIGYAYDTLDRMVSRTLDGGDTTNYAYDLAGRLTRITYRGQDTIYDWDAAGRLVAKTLPNGIKQEYAYDDADRVLSISFKHSGGALIDSVAYTYDARGNRTSRSTGVAAVRETPFTATYDAANRMSTMTLSATGETFSLAHDDNGNLVSKQGTTSGTTTYAWDARDRLVAIASPGVDARFAYDALGRRIARTVNGVTTQYVYDGMQAIGELANTQLTATILTGLQIDEVLARYSAAGNRSMLTDALGSVIALAGDDQVVSARYGYSAHGETQVNGSDDGNSIRYTAREDDGTGLMFYRARYYDSVGKRFIAEDPIGLLGGMNTYAYVENSPISKSDPLGLATYICTREIGGSKPPPWWAQRYSPINFRHEYLCVDNNCQGKNGDQNDVNRPELCRQVEPTNQCLEKCLLEEFPNANSGAYLMQRGDSFGQQPPKNQGNCQDWAETTLYNCRTKCNAFSY